MTTCAQAIKAVFTSNDQILTARQIIKNVEKKHPGQWREATIRTHTMGCSVNHSSSKWYPSFPKFLYTVGRGKVRLYDKKRDGEYDINKVKLTDSEDIVTEEDAIEATLSLERDLQEHLSRDISQLKPGLELFTEEGLSGREVSTEAGKIDVLAKDPENRVVVIELKASKASLTTLGQILSYMASIKKDLDVENVCGIIVAEEFDHRLKLAVTQVGDVELMKYKVKFDFEKVS